MKRLALAWLCGALSVLGYLYHLGAHEIVQLGLKLDAVQTRYVFDARPEVALDESLVAAALQAPKRGRR